MLFLPFSMTMPDILRLDAVTKSYTPDSPPAVNNVSFTLGQGEILGLLGPSGCGKTTLLRLIAGFEQPEHGTIYLGQQPVCGSCWLPPERRDVGILFQDYALFPHLTVEKNVAFGLQQRSRRSQLSGDQVKQQTVEAIALVGLSGLEHRFPHELSGGQQQRVALARALAPRPALILLDEPFSNLDVQVRIHLRQEVRDILRQVGASGVFVTHDQEEAMAMADRVAVMRQGRIEQLGTPETVYSQPESRFIADFVTQANFLAACRDAKGWQTELGCFDIAVEPGPCLGVDVLRSITEPARGDLMLRQEDIDLVHDENGPLLVRDRQFLGREYKYCLQAPSGQTLHARLPVGNAIPLGNRVRLMIKPRRVRLYASQAPDLPREAREISLVTP